MSPFKNYKNTIILLTDVIKSAAYSNINFTSSLIRELHLFCFQEESDESRVKETITSPTSQARSPSGGVKMPGKIKK